MSAVHLDDASVEAVAHRVAELLRGESTAGELVDVAEVARRFGVSRDYVYEHADDLGAVRLGDGPKARLRFDPETVAGRLGASSPEPSPRPQRRPRRGTKRVDLLPVHGGGERR
ncbi:MAG TPA: hypothetical protein VFW48_00570 [Solirubrobacterales bacterium]|nr:hypothetical protein [Solirubrobacterales bacterium]